MDKATLDKLLSVGVQNGASDIHFRPGDPPIYRVNGVLRPLRMDKLAPEHTREVALHLCQPGPRAGAGAGGHRLGQELHAGGDD